jgi:phosphoribosyl 1,2-cyclic phosphodiesterase
MRPTCFLVNDAVAIDAGALSYGLSLREQLDVGHIFLSHSHIDHLYTIPFLLDNLFSHIETPVVIHGAPHTLKSLKEHLFNNDLWPDFTALSNERSRIVKLEDLDPGQAVEAGGVKITSAVLDHTVTCYGYLLEDDFGAAFVFGDTASVDGALPLMEKTKNLKLVILEASFPARMEKLASLSKHLTTAGFAREAAKLPAGLRILATHMKPDCLGEIRNELEHLELDHVTLAEQGATYDLDALGT